MIGMLLGIGSVRGSLVGANFNSIFVISMPAKKEALSSPEKVWPKTLFAFTIDPTNNNITGIEIRNSVFIFNDY